MPSRIYPIVFALISFFDATAAIGSDGIFNKSCEDAMGGEGLNYRFSPAMVYANQLNQKFPPKINPSDVRLFFIVPISNTADLQSASVRKLLQDFNAQEAAQFSHLIAFVLPSDALRLPAIENRIKSYNPNAVILTIDQESNGSPNALHPWKELRYEELNTIQKSLTAIWHERLGGTRQGEGHKYIVTQQIPFDARIIDSYFISNLQIAIARASIVEKSTSSVLLPDVDIMTQYTTSFSNTRGAYAQGERRINHEHRNVLKTFLSTNLSRKIMWASPLIRPMNVSLEEGKDWIPELDSSAHDALEESLIALLKKELPSEEFYHLDELIKYFSKITSLLRDAASQEIIEYVQTGDETKADPTYLGFTRIDWVRSALNPFSTQTPARLIRDTLAHLEPDHFATYHTQTMSKRVYELALIHYFGLARDFPFMFKKTRELLTSGTLAKVLAPDSITSVLLKSTQSFRRNAPEAFDLNNGRVKAALKKLIKNLSQVDRKMIDSQDEIPDLAEFFVQFSNSRSHMNAWIEELIIATDPQTHATITGSREPLRWQTYMVNLRKLLTSLSNHKARSESIRIVMGEKMELLDQELNHVDPAKRMCDQITVLLASINLGLDPRNPNRKPITHQQWRQVLMPWVRSKFREDMVERMMPDSLTAELNRTESVGF